MSVSNTTSNSIIQKQALGQLKICVEKILDHHQGEFHEIHAKSKSQQHLSKLRAAFFTKKIWSRHSVVTICFLSSGEDIPRTPYEGGTGEDPLQNEVENLSVQQAIRKVVYERIQPIVDLKMVFVDNPDEAKVRISFDPYGGSWSLIGTDCLHMDKSKPTMNFGWFDVATTIHEFGHVLALIHEHQNPNNNQIDWDDDKVYKWAQSTQGWDKSTTYKNILMRYSVDQVNGSVYDPESIMLYFFPDSLTKNGKGTHQNLRLSPHDVTYINKMYPKSPETAAAFYETAYGKSLNTGGNNGESMSRHIVTIVVLAVILICILLFAILVRSLILKQK